MSNRVSLVDRFKKDKTEIDPAVEAAFIKSGTVEGEANEQSVEIPKPTSSQVEVSNQTAAITPGLISVNVRIRPELAQALKTASLVRQMRGAEPFTRREIVEVCP